MEPDRNELPALPARPNDGHKGTFGTVIVVGGCATMLGAPALTARAALRIGTGLVKALVDPVLGLALPQMLLSVTDVPWDGRVSSLVESLKEADPKRSAVLAVGPGWGRSRQRQMMLRKLAETGRSMVVDADGLFALAQILSDGGTIEFAWPVVLTPHPGEFARLAEAVGADPQPRSDEARKAAASELAKALGATVILKGQRSVIADGQTCAINQTGNAALATAGTGDVLTGIVAGLMAQGLGAFDAAALGAHLHGLAGERWQKERGRAGLLAEELADLLPEVMGDFTK
jgi:NAD(P)H-hydrate epimerase